MAVFCGSDVLTNAAHWVGAKKCFQQKASESSAMVALLWLRYWLCMLLSGVYGSLFSTRAELRDALLQRLGLFGRDDAVPRDAASRTRSRSEASTTSQSIRLMRRGTKRRPNVRAARCSFSEYPFMVLHGVLWEIKAARLKASLCVKHSGSIVMK